ncbi:MAG: hypothetical protein QXS27_06400 [Candidatus Jordarchaeaceae archaeon]
MRGWFRDVDVAIIWIKKVDVRYSWRELEEYVSGPVGVRILSSIPLFFRFRVIS